MFNKKFFLIIKYFENYVFYFNIFDIVQYNNNKKFKKIILIFLKNQNIKIINEKPRIFRI